ncbi:alpha/beta hydrolase [Ferrovibrio sp. MS7]|uniref:alpha/beta fold hydrolase n=1 Tax=Ferrovibrio plantarum TaxID=3119164 RepID=UPI003135091B
MLFEGFETRRIAGAGAEIFCRIGGSGPPLLLLHGYPQTHAMWHKVAPRLAEKFTVICADLRGYGDSSKPDSDAAHRVYSKRATAADMVTVMQALGYPRFRLAGHDRGGRVSHRLALDFPAAIERVAVLDIIPTLTLFNTVNQAVATSYYHWFFLAQPNPHPERMIGADPDYYLESKLRAWSAAAADIYAPQAMAEYKRCFRDPRCIHATCEDYRAGASIDLDDDRADSHMRVDAPLLVLWGANGAMQKNYDVLATWREKARDVHGEALPCGHFLPEEAPQETFHALNAFFA